MQALVLVYSDLLDFCFLGRKVLKSKNIPWAAVKNHSSFANISNSFSSHIEGLDKAIDAATYGIVSHLHQSVSHLEQSVSHLDQNESNREGTSISRLQ